MQRLPVTRSEDLVSVYRGSSGVFAYPGYTWIRDGNHVFDGFAAWGGMPGDARGTDNGVAAGVKQGKYGSSLTRQRGSRRVAT